MDARARKRILIVANRTAATPTLIDEVAARARREPCRFALLIPAVPKRKGADWTPEVALPLLEQAAGGSVEAQVAGPDLVRAIKHAVERGDYDELIISTLPVGSSRWPRRDLASKLRSLGLPITVITAPGIGDPVRAGQSATPAFPGGGL